MGPKQVKAVRLFLRMSQAEFGAALGVGRQTVKQWESGINRIPFDRAAQILRVFEIAPESLLPPQTLTSQRSHLVHIIGKIPPDNLDKVRMIVRAFVFNAVCQPEEPRKR